jgi:two-component system chemotaxis response regulator CheB
MSDVRVVRQRAFTDTAPASRARTVEGATVREPKAVTDCVDEPTIGASEWRSRGARPSVVGIGASTGGPPAVVQLLTDLGGHFPLPVLIVQHIIPSFLPGFVSWLDGAIPGRAVIAREGDVPVPGTVYLPPADHHIEMDSHRIRLTQAPALSMQRPSATVMFRSIARSAGSSGLGVLLTGMGDDGADGLVELRRQGGHTIAEHHSTAIVYGMPKAAVDRGGAAECLPLRDIGPRVSALVRAGQEVG